MLGEVQSMKVDKMVTLMKKMVLQESNLQFDHLQPQQSHFHQEDNSRNLHTVEKK